MDRVSATLLKEFVNTQGLSSLQESEAFEYFSNYSVLFGELSDTIDLDDISVGDDGNIGVDGIATIVNGVHVTSEQDADSIVKSNGFLDADFVFIQAKTSASFDLGEIGKFLFAVTDFFSTPPKLSHNQAVTDLMRLKDHLYKRSGDMTNRNPNLSMFYVCTGKWTSDPTLQTRIASGIEELERTNLFAKVKFAPIDASQLQRL